MSALNREMSRLVDSELVAEVRQGSRDAFGVLISRHYQTCVNIACFILRDRGDAQDEVQNACCKAFEHIDQYHGEAEFSSWLLRIVTNQCLMLIRDRRRARFLYIDADPDRDKKVPIELPATSEDPEHELMNHEFREVLKREIRRIPPLLRNVLVLRDVQEVPMPEVATQLKISVPAAKSRLFRARAELKDRVIKQCGNRTTRDYRSGLKAQLRPAAALGK